jgi:hypothetical protein
MSLTGEQIAATFERVTGTPAGYSPVPLDVVRSSMPDIGHDFAAMFEFFQLRDVVGLDRDLPAPRGMHPGPLDFEAWLRTSLWTAPSETSRPSASRRAARIAVFVLVSGVRRG